jgi:hypothetical protein
MPSGPTARAPSATMPDADPRKRMCLKQALFHYLLHSGDNAVSASRI